MRTVEALFSVRLLLPDLLCEVLNGLRGGRLVGGSTLADAIKL